MCNGDDRDLVETVNSFDQTLHRVVHSGLH